MILYSPLHGKPLIQKDSRQFKSYFIPEFESNQVSIRWKLLARDYSREGKVNFKVIPEFENEIRMIEVDCESDEKEEIDISEFIEIKERK